MLTEPDSPASSPGKTDGLAAVEDDESGKVVQDSEENQVDSAPEFDPDATVADTEGAGLAALKVADLLDKKEVEDDLSPDTSSAASEPTPKSARSTLRRLPAPLVPPGRVIPPAASPAKVGPARTSSVVGSNKKPSAPPSESKVKRSAPADPGSKTSQKSVTSVSPSGGDKPSIVKPLNTPDPTQSVKATLLGIAAIPPAKNTKSSGEDSPSSRIATASRVAPPVAPPPLPFSKKSEAAKRDTPSLSDEHESEPLAKSNETSKLAKEGASNTVETPAPLDEESTEKASPIDELETAILPPVSSSIVAQKLSDSSPFNTDTKPPDSVMESSPFDDPTDIGDVLTKTVADMSVDVAILDEAVKKPVSEFPRSQSPDVLTRTVADAAPVLSPAPSIEIKQEPAVVTPAPPPPSTATSPVHTAAPSAVLPVVRTPAPVVSPSQLLPRPPSASGRPTDVLPRPGSAGAPSPFTTPGAQPSSPSIPDAAEIPAAYALPGMESAAVPGHVPRAQSGGFPAAGHVPTNDPPPIIGPPPDLSAPSYPDAALSALSDEADKAPGGNVNQVWRQAHPSAQRWAEKRQIGAPRTPKPSMIAVGLMLTGLGIYLLSIFLPSKAPLSAAAKKLLLTHAGVDENAWRFTESFMTIANINAGLFLVLGVVVFFRGALFRQPIGQSQKSGKKTSLLLIFCFVLLALSFGSLVLFASLG